MPAVIAGRFTSKLPILENVRVAAPCSADWEQMAGTRRIRYCCDCNLSVYNLSEMTGKEAEQLIRRHEGRLCVRFYRRADGTILTQNCPRGLRLLINRISRVGGAILAACMSVGASLAQTQKADAPPQAQDGRAASGLDLTVVDPTGALIPNAAVILCHCKDQGNFNRSTDAGGVAHFTGMKSGTYSVRVQAAGFKAIRKEIILHQGKLGRLQVQLQVAPATVTVEVKTGGLGVEVGEIVMLGSEPSPLGVGSGAGHPALMRR